MYSIHSITNCNDLLEAFDLNSESSDHESQWSHINKPTKETDHHESEEGANHIISPSVRQENKFALLFVILKQFDQ